MTNIQNDKKQLKVINTVLQRQELLDKPVVLVDIGASDTLNPKWQMLAPYSVCIAFDADEEHLHYTTYEQNHFMKLHVISSVVHEKPCKKASFYMTKLRAASSCLKPDSYSIREWAISPLLEITEKVERETIDLPTILQSLNLNYVDWFKSDSQGTDLRLFKSLEKHIIERVIVAEFEPGIINAYLGEDKLWEIMAFMEKKRFWLSDMILCGTQRISPDTINFVISQRQNDKSTFFLRKSPCWAELTYINSLKRKSLGIREFLLGWVFSTIEHQHAFAIEIAIMGNFRFKDSIFDDLAEASKKFMLHESIPVNAYSPRSPFMISSVDRFSNRLEIY